MALEFQVRSRPDEVARERVENERRDAGVRGCEQKRRRPPLRQHDER